MNIDTQYTYAPAPPARERSPSTAPEQLSSHPAERPHSGQPTGSQPARQEPDPYATTANPGGTADTAGQPGELLDIIV